MECIFEVCSIQSSALETSNISFQWKFFQALLTTFDGAIDCSTQEKAGLLRNGMIMALISGEHSPKIFRLKSIHFFQIYLAHQMSIHSPNNYFFGRMVGTVETLCEKSPASQQKTSNLCVRKLDQWRSGSELKTGRCRIPFPIALVVLTDRSFPSFSPKLV